MPTAKFIPQLGPSGLTEEQFEDVGVLIVRGNHDLFHVGGDGTFIRDGHFFILFAMTAWVFVRDGRLRHGRHRFVDHHLQTKSQSVDKHHKV